MSDQTVRSSAIPTLAVVALLQDVPGESLRRGQVGTVVEPLDANTVLVEFADSEGRGYAIVPVRCDILLPLLTEPAAA